MYILPGVLNEISGIVHNQNGILYCINDEDGIVFLYDVVKEEIVKKINFGKNGDYEDIAIVESQLYVLKSNGTIYRIDNYDETNEIKSKKICGKFK